MYLELKYLLFELKKCKPIKQTINNQNSSIFKKQKKKNWSLKIKGSNELSNLKTIKTVKSEKKRNVKSNTCIQ